MNSEDITMEDVQTAITILTRFIRKENEVKAILARVTQLSRQGSSSSGLGAGTPSFDKIIGMVMDETERRKAAKTEDITEGITAPEDIEKMKALTQKFKKEPPASTTQ